MKFLKDYLRNLLGIALIIGFMLIFAMIFYPSVLSIFPQIGQLYSALKLWPLIILMVLVGALPRRRRS